MSVLPYHVLFTYYIRGSNLNERAIQLTEYVNFIYLTLILYHIDYKTVYSHLLQIIIIVIMLTGLKFWENW